MMIAMMRVNLMRNRERNESRFVVQTNCQEEKYVYNSGNINRYIVYYSSVDIGMLEVFFTMSLLLFFGFRKVVSMSYLLLGKIEEVFVLRRSVTCINGLLVARANDFKVFWYLVFIFIDVNVLHFVKSICNPYGKRENIGLFSCYRHEQE